MPIRREYARVSDYAGLARLAGQAEASRRAGAQAAALATTLIQAKAAKERSEQEMRFRKEMSEFSAQLDIEAAKRAQMFEMEKMEQRSRIDFAMQEKLRMQKEEEKQAKLKKLEGAYTSKEITQGQYEQVRAEVEYGVRLRAPSEMEQLERMTREQTTANTGQQPDADMAKLPTYDKPVSKGKGVLGSVGRWYPAGPAAGWAGAYMKPNITMVEPKTQVEYDAIPSGTAYKDTDGVIRIKR